MTRLRRFWAWLRPATPDDPRPGHDRQWAEDMPHLLNRFNEPGQQDNDDRRRDP